MRVTEDAGFLPEIVGFHGMEAALPILERVAGMASEMVASTGVVGNARQRPIDNLAGYEQHGKSYLFVTTGMYALGETYIAACFAEELRVQGVCCYFVAPVLGARFLQAFSFPVLCLGCDREENERQLAHYVAGVRPSFVIVADAYTFDINPPMRRLLDPNRLHRFGVPVASFDYFGMAPEGKRVTFAHNGLTAVLGADDRVCCWIRPCPPNWPSLGPTERVVWSRIEQPDLPVNEDTRQEIRAAIGCGEEELLILLPIATWASAVCRLNGLHLYDYLQEIIEHYLSELRTRVHVIGVCGMPLFRDRACGPVHFYRAPPLSFYAFEALLRSCDLLITDSSSGSVIGRAVSAGIPVARLRNSHDIASGQRLPASVETDAVLATVIEQLRRCGRRQQIYPFTNYPWGWVAELDPMLRGNPLSKCSVPCELLGGSATATTLTLLLEESETRRAVQRNCAEYNSRLLELAGAAEVVRAIETAH